MLDKYKSFISKIGISGFANFLVSISSFLLIPILTKNLTIEDYGIWAQVIITLSLIQGVSSLGLQYGLLRFFGNSKDNEIADDFYSIFILVTIVSILTSVIFLIFAHPISLAIFSSNYTVTIIVSVIFPFEILIPILLNYFRSQQKINEYCLFLIILYYSMLLIVSTMILLDFMINGALIGLLVSRILVFFILVIIIVKEMPPKLPKYTNIQKYLNFSLPIVPEFLSSWLINSSDRYLITLFLGISFVGYYSPGYALGNLIFMLISPILTVITPFLVDFYEKDDLGEVKKTLNYCIKYFCVFAIPCVVGLSILSKPLLIEISTYEIALNSYLVTPFIALSIFFYGLQVIFAQILILKNKTKLSALILGICAIINILLNLILIPYFGILAAAFSTLTTFLISFILTLTISKSYIKLKIDLKTIFKSSISAFIMGIFIFFLPNDGFLNIILSIILSIILYFSIFFILKGFKENEIEILKSFF